MPVDPGFFRKLSDAVSIEVARDILGTERTAEILGVSRGALDVWRSRGKKTALTHVRRERLAREIAERVGDPLYAELVGVLDDVRARLAAIERELIQLGRDPVLGKQHKQN